MAARPSDQGGRGHLPCAGGMLDQPANLLRAFAFLDATFAQYRDALKGNRAAG